MKVVFDKSFSKSLDKIRSKSLKSKISKVILEIESSKSITEIQGLKKMTGFRSFYRIRIGDYRLGIELENNLTIRFIVMAHRKDIYRIFP